MEELEFKISQLVDNELDDSEKAELFKALADNKTGRQIFSELLNIKKTIGSYYSGLETDIVTEHAQFKVINTQQNLLYKTGFYFSFAATIVLAMLLFFSHAENKKFSNEINVLESHISILDKTIDKINTLPPLNIKFGGKKQSPAKAIQRKSRPNKNTNRNMIVVEAKRMLKEQFAKLDLAKNKIVITQNDFIGGKVVAN